MIEQRVGQVSSTERAVLEVASVAGAQFSAAAVAAGVETTVEAVEEQCAELVRREQFLRASGVAEWPDGTVATRYSFVHALHQDVLYQRLTARQRQRLHQQVGEREELAYGDRAGEIAAELAVHFERGRDYRRAIQYLQQAGETAARRSAYQEAIALLTKGLGLLKTLPDTPECLQQELMLQLALSSALAVAKGYASPEVERAWMRARELCQQVGETAQSFRVLRGLWQVAFIRAQFQTTRERAEQLLTLALSEQDQTLLLQAHLALGTTLFKMGEFAPAREQLGQCLALYHSGRHRLGAFFHPDDLEVASLCYAAWVLWYLGYSDQALQRGREALTLAQELSCPFSLAFALNGATHLHLYRREGQAAQERAEALIALASEHGFPFWAAVGTMLRGAALTVQGQVEEGMAQMRQSMAAHRATGAEEGRPSQLSRLAWAYGQINQVKEGLAMVAEAVATVHITGERINEAELYRLKGELTLQKFQLSGFEFQVLPNPQSLAPSPQAEAEECFLKAIDIARKQQAKSLELRASMSLARLWQQQGKQKEAHQLLAEIYSWFTEGFDTKDLQEAKALLEELA
jgi:predicted ATPase